MIGFLSRKVMWVGRATTFCVGVAVVLAVVFGVGTAALAAVPGDPFRLGRHNYVERLTALVGVSDGAVLKVDNNGSGTALSLRVGDPDTTPENEPTPPMTVDSQAKVANLNADELDGLDYRQFMQKPSYTDWTVSDADSSTRKVVIAPCPPGSEAIGSGARITATSGVATGSEVPVALTVSEAGGSNGWRVEAQEMVPFDGSWYLLVSPLCIPWNEEVAVPDRQNP